MKIKQFRRMRAADDFHPFFRENPRRFILLKRQLVIHDNLYAFFMKDEAAAYPLFASPSTSTF
jgi:hypothetical protein